MVLSAEHKENQMKKIIVTVMLLSAAAAVFANGTREQASAAANQSFRGISGEEAVLSGVLDVTGEEVVIDNGDGTFTLSTRGGALLDIEQYDGASAVVSGYLTDCQDCVNGYDGHMFVTEAEVNGEEFALSAPGRWSDDWEKGRAALDQRGAGGFSSDNGRGADMRRAESFRPSVSGPQAPKGAPVQRGGRGSI
jgi:hypothetical protein